MIAIGADVHKRTCTLAMQGEDGQLTMLPSMENTRENWLHRLAKLPPQAEIALEVSTSGHFVMSVLEEAGWRERAHWVHTAGVDSLKKQKNDRLDAKRLARKLSVAERDPLPEAWFPPPPIRELRLRARQRCWTAVGRAQCRNRLRSLYESGEVSHHGGITRQGPAWLRWALITAAHAVTRSKSPLARRYWRLRRRKRPNVAKTAVAGSIARCVYGVLKHGGAYQEERWGRQTGDELKQEA